MQIAFEIMILEPYKHKILLPKIYISNNIKGPVSKYGTNTKYSDIVEILMLF